MEGESSGGGLALRVGGLEAVVKQIANTQAHQTALLERVVRLEERQAGQADTLARLEADVAENAKGVTAAGPWVNFAQKAGGGLVAALATSVAAFVAVKFGLPGG